MTDSFDYYAVAPEALRPIQQAGKLAHGSGLEDKLLTLVHCVLHKSTAAHSA